MIESLKYVESDYTLIVLVTPNVNNKNRELFACLGATVIEKPILKVPG